jgi:methylaspartate ammonia-lyase
MKITKVLFTPGNSSFFFDDQKAIKTGATQDGFVYRGDPVTEGFPAIRTAGEAVSILLILEDGSIAVGDACAVQYSGTGGRDPLFLAQRYIPFMETHLRPLLEGRELTTFRADAEFFDHAEVGGRRLHTAIRYGLTQALLDAHARAQSCFKTEVVLREWNLPARFAPVPLFGQTGDDRYLSVDKMILKQVDALPHGLINNVPDKLGRHGEKLQEYIFFLVNRVKALRPDPAYVPALHIDVYGTIGLIFDHDMEKITDYLARLTAYSQEFPLYLEGPVYMCERQAQIYALGAIRRGLAARGSEVKIVADEWCNTVEDVVDFTDAQCCDMVQIKTPDLGGIQNIVDAVLYCNEHGMESYQGGTCNETDTSARTCVHLALATHPQRMLVKPGMGFDEGLTIVRNEMNRMLALLNWKYGEESCQNVRWNFVC